MTNYNNLRAMALAAQQTEDHYITRSISATMFANAASPGIVLGLLDELESLREQLRVKDAPHTAPRCRQQLAAEGKPYPRSSCEACGQFSPNWRECDARIAAISSPENPS